MAEEQGQNAQDRAREAPDPEDPRKPDDPTDITKPSWIYVARKTLREFSTDQATDLAATLTYYGTLAVFPALLAFVSIIGLIGDPQKTTDSLLQLAGGLIPSSTLDVIKGPIANLAKSPAAGVTFITGILGALWSASGYVGAFSRAMNRIYGIQEGRPVWKLRPVTLFVTIVAILVAVAAAALIVLSGPIAETIGRSIGLGDTVLTIWDFAKWPVLLVLVVLVIALLYYATPNVKQPKFKWMSIGSLVAIVVALVASAGFAFYAANFSNYNATYGSIGGIIVFLLWFWIINNALLFGAELDAELERGRELQAGIAAEENIQLPPRDTHQSDKKEIQHEVDVEVGRRLREGEDVRPKDVKKEIVEKHEDEEKAAENAPQTEAEQRKAQTKKMKSASKKLARTNHSQAATHIAEGIAKKDK
jgi:membrane protein